MITIKGSYVGNRRDGEEAVDFFRRGLIVAPFKTVPLKELGNVFELMGGFFSSLFSFVSSVLLYLISVAVG